jgi:hypothetical protein
MLNIILLIVVGLIFFGIVTFVKEQKKESRVKTEKPKEDIGHFYYAKKSLMTPTERNFYKELQVQSNNRYATHSKVRLEDIVGVANGVGSRHREMRNHIKSRHVDFIITEHSGEIIAIIELDDKSHDTKKAQVGDEIKNQIFEYNKVRFYRVRVGETYSERIKNILKEVQGA